MFLDIIKKADPATYDPNSQGKRLSSAMKDIEEVSSLPDEQKLKIRRYYADVYLKILKKTN